MASISSKSGKKRATVALLGNPNSGKSSIFNYLTGLRQKTGNFPGVTVDKKVGKFKLASGETIDIVDLPGAYSLHATSEDERIVCKTLIDPLSPERPDAILYVADFTQLEKHLLLFTQVRDLGIPCLLLLNMADLASKKGISVDIEKLEKNLGTTVIEVSGRQKATLYAIKGLLEELLLEEGGVNMNQEVYALGQQEDLLSNQVIGYYHEKHGISLNPYQAYLLATYGHKFGLIEEELESKLELLTHKLQFNQLHHQVGETMRRYDHFVPVVQATLKVQNSDGESDSDRIDKIVMHRIWGPVLFFGIMLVVFQAIYAWAAYPMDLIEGFFASLSGAVFQTFGDGWFSSLLADGVLAGLGGIAVFVPQIAILFILISVLEEVGYMSRAVYMFDKLMQRFGLNGRSIVALISGGACAIPAIMSARTISNPKERLITIMVTPFISCSARIPVYIVLIGFVVPAMSLGGILNLQGLVFMGLYMLGIIAALGSGWVFHKILKTDQVSYLAMELPDYKWPVWVNVWHTVWGKVKTFLWEAGKIIFIISILLWLLASFGPGNHIEKALTETEQISLSRNLDETEKANLLAAKELEYSYAGRIGKLIEPAIEPLGYDWKIGIALLTSFAAREVFIGTMATIYSLGSEEDELKIHDRMSKEVNPITGEPIYNLATSLSLLLFYVFAMQCMSTLAIVKRETKSWKWPIVQFVFMSGVAYLVSLVVYQLLV